jgi:hypothetical protein
MAVGAIMPGSLLKYGTASFIRVPNEIYSRLIPVIQYKMLEYIGSEPTARKKCIRYRDYKPIAS